MSDTTQPLYKKIVESLKEEIEQNVYSPGKLLPTEDELTKIFDASRTTVRSAIGILENEGYVIRKQGKGTIVQDPKAAQNMNYLSSFTETFQAKGFRVETGILSIASISPPQKVYRELGLDEGEKVYRIQRTRVVNEIPIAYVNNYIVARIVPGLENREEELKHAGLYQVLESEYRLQLYRAIDTINVYLSGPMESEILQLTEPTPLFHNKRITWLTDGRAFEYVISIIRGDMYQYNVYLEERKKK